MNKMTAALITVAVVHHMIILRPRAHICIILQVDYFVNIILCILIIIMIKNISQIEFTMIGMFFVNASRIKFYNIIMKNDFINALVSAYCSVFL